MSDFDFDQSPKRFFENQAKIFGEENREGGDYEEFVVACRRVMSTESGKRMMNGLKRIHQYGSNCFSPDDDFNTHAAAARDGAHSVINEIIVAMKLGDALKNKNEDQ